MSHSVLHAPPLSTLTSFGLFKSSILIAASLLLVAWIADRIMCAKETLESPRSQPTGTVASPYPAKVVTGPVPRRQEVYQAVVVGTPVKEEPASTSAAKGAFH